MNFCLGGTACVGMTHLIDPVAAVVANIEIASACVVAAGFSPDMGSPELMLARNNVSVVRGLLRQVNQMPFWGSLVIPRAQKSRVLETDRDQRSELLAAARDYLRGGDVTRAEIVSAMDALHRVVTSMSTMFAVGKIGDGGEPDDAWALDRYMCSALLPKLAEQMDNFWVQLRKSIVRAAGEQPESRTAPMANPIPFATPVMRTLRSCNQRRR